MKLEQINKGKKTIQDTLDLSMSPNKIFLENKIGMPRLSIFCKKKKKYDKIFL